MGSKRTSASTEGKPWAVYARLSKAAQTGDLEKVEYQEELCRKYAESRGLPVSDDHVYIDNSLSAWKHNVRRPDWERLMEAAGRGEVAGILVYAVDRFTRRPKDLEALIELAEDHGMSIEGPRSGRLDLTTATGRQQARWMGMQAASESDNTSERVKTTLARKMREGKPMGGGRLYGFETGGETQRPEEVAVLRDVANRVLAGEPLQKLATELNGRGRTTSRGGPWTGGNLGRTLGHARYGGHVEHHGEIVGTIPGDPVLDADTYTQVRALLASRRRGRRPTGMFSLTGVLTCSTCQQPMNGYRVSMARADGSHPRAYRCPPQRGGCGRSIMAEQVERIVAEHMIGLLSDPDTVAKIVAQNATINASQAANAARLAAVEQELGDLEVKKAMDEIPQIAYDRVLPVLQAKWKRVKAEEVTVSTAAAVEAHDARVEWNDPGMDDEQKRSVIRRYKVRIEVTRKNPGTRRFDPDRVTFPA